MYVVYPPVAHLIANFTMLHAHSYPRLRHWTLDVGLRRLGIDIGGGSLQSRFARVATCSRPW